MTNTSEIYTQIIIENIIKKHLQKGSLPSIQEIEEEFNQVAITQDLDSSDFTSEEWKVKRKEQSSTSKFNGMNSELTNDLTVLYRSLIENSSRSSALFNRWQVKAQGLENRLRGLESRIDRLLDNVVSTFSSSIGDKFINTNLIDLDRSNGIAVNLDQNVVLLENSSTSVDRIFLNDLESNQAVFTSLTKANVISVKNITGTEPRFSFRDSNQFWKTHVNTTKKISPVTGELLLKLEEKLSLTRIDIYLHASQSNAVTKVTPLYSIDGVNFSQVPSINTIGEGLDKVTFQFPEIEFQFLKLIFQKTSHDFIESNFFVYEFGAREIALFNHSFSSSTGTLKSKTLSVENSDKSLLKFNKIGLEVCEAVTEEVRLDYQIALAKSQGGEPLWLVTSGLSTSIELDGEDQRLWFPISPSNRTVSTYPKLLDLTSLTRNEKSDIAISFSRDNVLTNPGPSYSLLEQSGDVLSYTNQTATDQRYLFNLPSHKLLNLQVDLDVKLNTDTLTLWRNVGEKGIESSDTTKLVRGVQAGWSYIAPYYYTVIKVKSSTGMLIDVGNNPITIDGVSYTGVIDGTILSPGTHKIKVHKDFWNSVEPDLNTLTELKSLDILYPFNQKLLIEGYQYGTTFSTEKIYKGADFFAQSILEKVSVFDFVNNISSQDFDRFAMDIDIGASTSTGPSRVFLVNTDNSIADFANERFMLEFDLTDELFSFVAIKAEFRTNSNKLSPILDEYIIKLGF
jgi:hypothetical protein